MNHGYDRCTRIRDRSVGAGALRGESRARSVLSVPSVVNSLSPRVRSKFRSASFFVRLFAIVLTGLLAFVARSHAEDKPPNKWEGAIRKFEEQDTKNPPAKGGIVFVGSSSIVGWKLDKHFPDAAALNRGFGGSQMADSVAFVDRLVTKHEPRVVVVYAGDNDIAAGKSPETVLDDYQQFVAAVHKKLPKTRIVYVAIKPSLKRWKLVERIRQANGLIQAEAAKDERLVFVDIDRPMIGSDGKPRAELFKDDGLHLNEAGYKLWSDLVRPHLKAD